MSISSYQQRAATQETPQSLELRAFGFVTQGLRQASTSPDPTARIRALHRNHQLWLTLVSDLATPENPLPDELKGRLITLGMWSMRYSLRAMEEDIPVDPLIDVNTEIAGGISDQIRRSASQNPATTPEGAGPIQTAV